MQLGNDGCHMRRFNRGRDYICLGISGKSKWDLTMDCACNIEYWGVSGDNAEEWGWTTSQWPYITDEECELSLAGSGLSR